MRNALIVALVALSGCAMPRWHHVNFSPAQFDQDRYQCTVQSNQMFPVAMTNTPNFSPPPPTRTTCTSFGNQMNCTSQQGYQQPVYQYDQNQIRRDYAFNDCMRSRGYWRQ